MKVSLIDCVDLEYSGECALLQIWATKESHSVIVWTVWDRSMVQLKLQLSVSDMYCITEMTNVAQAE